MGVGVMVGVGVLVAVGVLVGRLSSLAAAARASIMPAPTEALVPPLTVWALLCKISFIWLWFMGIKSERERCSTNAATAAAWGAAALVP